jgi:protoheme IX farnesyltransferase
MIETVKLIYTTAKVRLGFLIVTCTLAGLAVSSGGGISPSQVLILSVAVLLSSAAAGAFNQLYERDIDAGMKRTRERPFVTGRFYADASWLWGLAAVLVSAVVAAAWATNVLAAMYVFLGAFTYGIVYTVWLKRRTWMNIVIGGLAGSFAVLAGAAAVGSTLEPAPLLLAVVLFLWTPPHFWAMAMACRRDYEAAGIPMLPVVVDENIATTTILVHTVAVVGLSLTLVFFGMGWLYMLGAATGGAYFLLSSWRLRQRPSIQQAWRTFAASIVQLGVLLVTAILDGLLLA